MRLQRSGVRSERDAGAIGALPGWHRILGIAARAIGSGGCIRAFARSEQHVRIDVLPPEESLHDPLHGLPVPCFCAAPVLIDLISLYRALELQERLPREPLERFLPAQHGGDGQRMK